MEKLRIGTDFSGVGAFEHAVKRLNLEHKSIFACDIDKYARISYLANHDEPDYFPTDVYEREIPTEPLDFYVSTFPCQSFSLAGKRLGKNDKRGILFYNTHEFIQKNNPRFFICENVKGLLSDDNGNTMNEIISLLGGKSVNGDHVWFPHEDSVPYHVYFKVMNAKKHGVPQNRERVFIIGIRDDGDNQFQFPKEEHLTRRLKDVLESEVDEKYFLSEKLLSYFADHKEIHKERGNGFKFEPHNEDTIASNAISTKCGTRQTDPFIKVKSPNKAVQCNQGIIVGGKWNDFKNENGEKKGFEPLVDGCSPTLLARARNDGSGMAAVSDGYQIRRLTPKECFRLMDFPDSHYENCKKEGVSDSQLYRQAGNSVVVKMFELLIKQLLKI
jgi:DNA (cytosine-5)-methyltransferase 1